MQLPDENKNLFRTYCGNGQCKSAPAVLFILIPLLYHLIIKQKHINQARGDLNGEHERFKKNQINPSDGEAE